MRESYVNPHTGAVELIYDEEHKAIIVEEKQNMSTVQTLIEKAGNITTVTNNFLGCMEDCQDGTIYTDRDGNVNPASLLGWLVDNPWAGEIANDLRKELKK